VAQLNLHTVMMAGCRKWVTLDLILRAILLSKPFWPDWMSVITCTAADGDAAGPKSGAAAGGSGAAAQAEAAAGGPGGGALLGARER